MLDELKRVGGDVAVMAESLPESERDFAFVGEFMLKHGLALIAAVEGMEADYAGREAVLAIAKLEPGPEEDIPMLPMAAINRQQDELNVTRQAAHARFLKAREAYCAAREE